MQELISGTAWLLVLGLLFTSEQGKTEYIFNGAYYDCANHVADTARMSHQKEVATSAPLTMFFQMGRVTFYKCVRKLSRRHLL